MSGFILTEFSDERQDEFRVGVPVDASCREQEWEITTFVGLFRAGRTMTLRATSQFAAECVAQQILSTDEWFPSFSARRV